MVSRYSGTEFNISGVDIWDICEGEEVNGGGAGAGDLGDGGVVVIVGSATCVFPLDSENLVANAPIPEPHDAKACLGEDVCECVESIDACFVEMFGLAVVIGDSGSRSALVIFTGGVLAPLLAPSLPVEEFDVVLCNHFPFTPSTALKKLADPAATVRATASRAGASCCSSFNSWMPSCNRRPMSVTTDTLSLHGCLTKCQHGLGPKK